MVLVITAEPGTATAASLEPGRAREISRAMVSPTLGSSLTVFSTTALGGNGSTP